MKYSTAVVIVCAFCFSGPVLANSTHCGETYAQFAADKGYKVRASGKADTGLSITKVKVYVVFDPTDNGFGFIAKGAQECNLVEGINWKWIEETTAPSEVAKTLPPKSLDKLRMSFELLKQQLAQYGETIVGLGDGGEGGVHKVVLFANRKTGTWSSVENLDQSGVLVAYGTDFELYSEGKEFQVK